MNLRKTVRSFELVSMAEEVGFEPTVSFPTTVFKTAAINQTLPLLRLISNDNIPLEQTIVNDSALLQEQLIPYTYIYIF